MLSWRVAFSHSYVRCACTTARFFAHQICARAAACSPLFGRLRAAPFIESNRVGAKPCSSRVAAPSSPRSVRQCWPSCRRLFRFTRAHIHQHSHAYRTCALVALLRILSSPALRRSSTFSSVRLNNTSSFVQSHSRGVFGVRESWILYAHRLATIVRRDKRGHEARLFKNSRSYNKQTKLSIVRNIKQVWPEWVL